MTAILVVDDEPTLRTILVEVLVDEGYTVVTARDGQEALEVFARDAPDLVLMDVMMPRMDGRAAFRAMREHAHGNGLPVILMSAMAEPADLDPEISAFLRKPLDLDHLLTLIAGLLTSR